MAIREDAHRPEFHRAAPPQLPVRCATTASITISTALNNGDSLDGLTLATGDRVLVKDQSTGSQNGVYIVGASPARAFDMAEGVAAWGAVIYVIAGTANGGKIFRNTNATLPTIDTTALTFTEFTGSGITGITVQDESSPLSTLATTLDFQGAGVTATGSGATKTITIGGGSGITVQDEGTPLTTAADTLNFVGSGVTATGTGTTKTVTISGGGGSGTYYDQPTVTNYAAQFQASSTTCAVTVTAPTAGDNLVAVVYAIGRGANSITQTNVTWTQRYTGNGNSSYLEVWTGVASASAGTTATANFTGSNTQYVEIFTVNSAAADFTAASAVATGTAASTALATVSGAVTLGNHIIVATSANLPSTSYTGVSDAYVALTAFGGMARSGIFRANAGIVSYWSLSSSATNYFTAIISIT